MNSLKKTIFFVLLLLNIQGVVTAQITAPLADKIDSTKYINENKLGKDPIFIFYSPGRNGWQINGSLSAEWKGIDELDFSWSSFNKTTNSFDAFIKEDLQVKKSTLSTSVEGGYKVHIKNVSKNIDTTLFAWVFINNFKITGIEVYYSSCERMELKSRLQFDTEFIYYDLTSFDEIAFNNEQDSLKYKWTATPEAFIPSVANPGFEAPTVETSYKLVITDKFGYSRTDRIDIENGANNGDGNIYLKAVKADFEASRSKLKGETDSTGQAPLAVQFINKSENSIDYKWTFYNHIEQRENIEDTILQSSVFEELIDSIIYKYPGNELPGYYDVALDVKGPIYVINGEEKQCTDRLLKSEYIRVDSTSIPEFPNVFTPNGDGKNEIFYFVDKKTPTSLKKFSIKIYSRWGDKIYDYEDNTGRNWEGWNGTTLGNIKAHTGVYYYGVLAEGWNGEKIKKSGFVHLFLDKN